MSLNTTNAAPSLLVKVLREPRGVLTLSESDWDLLVRQARRTQLLARLEAMLSRHGLVDHVPGAVRPHLQSARAVAVAHTRAVRWEIDRIQHALREVGVPVVLLKGAAYAMAALPVACGRTFNDIDIMVPKASLSEVEHALNGHGWITTHLDAYDQRYYRTWMHELPPLLHVRRQTVLDVHHTIMPETARLHPDPKKLLADATPIAAAADLYVLSPADMVLHSAAHLFYDGELEHGLRDLVDLDLLLHDFGRDTAFWPSLTQRAAELNLERPLFYALRYTQRVLGTTIPDAVQAAAQSARPGGLWPAVMDGLFDRALRPDHDSCDTALTGFARWCLYVRAHYLRMPLHLLIPHLLRKTFRRQQEA